MQKSTAFILGTEETGMIYNLFLKPMMMVQVIIRIFIAVQEVGDFQVKFSMNLKAFCPCAESTFFSTQLAFVYAVHFALILLFSVCTSACECECKIMST